VLEGIPNAREPNNSKNSFFVPWRFFCLLPVLSLGARSVLLVPLLRLCDERVKGVDNCGPHPNGSFPILAPVSDVTYLNAAGLKREQDALGKKLKTVEAAVKGVEKEMDDFQKEKQGALNQIDVALTLSLHQVIAHSYAAYIFTLISCSNRKGKMLVQGGQRVLNQRDDSLTPSVHQVKRPVCVLLRSVPYHHSRLAQMLH
jgi:hypothetical protein